MTYHNISMIGCEIPVDLLLGRRVRRQAKTNIVLCDPPLFKANLKTKTVPAIVNIRNILNASLIQPQNSTRIILVADNQISRLDEDNRNIEPLVEETTSQSELQFQKRDVEASHQEEASAATSTAEQQKSE